MSNEFPKIDVTYNNGTFAPSNEKFYEEMLPEGVTVETVDRVQEFKDKASAGYFNACYRQAKDMNFIFGDGIEQATISPVNIGNHIKMAGTIRPNGELDCEVEEYELKFTTSLMNMAKQNYISMNEVKE